VRTKREKGKKKKRYIKFEICNNNLTELSEAILLNARVNARLKIDLKKILSTTSPLILTFQNHASRSGLN